MVESEEKNRLRDVQKDLYTVDGIVPKKRSVVHQERGDVPTEWSEPTEIVSSLKSMTARPQKTSWFKKIFLGSVAVFFITIIFFAVNFFTGTNAISAKNVDLEITTRTFVDGGESFLVQVAVTNRNRLPLELAELTLEYPERTAENPEARAQIVRSVGTLGSGEIHQESFTIMLYGEEGSKKDISASLNFRVAGSNVVYESNSTFPIIVRTSPANLVASIPADVVPNQEFPIVFTVTANGTQILPRTALVVDAPDGFSITRSETSPIPENGVWQLGDIPAGTSKTVTIYGTLSGSLNEIKTIKASVGTHNQTETRDLTTVYKTITQAIAISGAFLDTHLVISGKTGNSIAIGASGQVTVQVDWRNTLSTVLTNAEIRVRLSGTAYDSTKIQSPTGFFDSGSNQVVWTQQQNQGLASLQPGQAGSFSFTLLPKVSTTPINNPTIQLSVDVLGFGTDGKRLTATNIDTKKLVVNSDLNLLARTIHYGGSIQNTGPMPPMPDQETTYALDWQITNFKNRVNNVMVSATLPVYVTWKGVILPASERSALSYNTVTREILWNVGEVSAGTGAGGGNQKTVSFKVGITPSVNQLGIAPDLTSSIIVKGRDDFTQSDLQFTKGPMRTSLLNDISNVGASGRVGGNQ